MHPDGLTAAEIVNWIEERTGTRVSIPTVYRWMLKGVHGVRLHSRRVAGKGWRVRPEELERLLDLCNTRRLPPTPVSDQQEASRPQPTFRRTAERQHQIQAATDGLRKKLGI
jgi:hypothetical protein